MIQNKLTNCWEEIKTSLHSKLKHKPESQRSAIQSHNCAESALTEPIENLNNQNQPISRLKKVVGKSVPLLQNNDIHSALL